MLTFSRDAFSYGTVSHVVRRGVYVYVYVYVCDRFTSLSFDAIKTSMSTHAMLLIDRPTHLSRALL